MIGIAQGLRLLLLIVANRNVTPAASFGGGLFLWVNVCQPPPSKALADLRAVRRLNELAETRQIGRQRLLELLQSVEFDADCGR